MTKCLRVSYGKMYCKILREYYNKSVTVDHVRGYRVKTQKITIKDVAREAGVSISTVSNALNGVDVLRPETRQHILEVAERLNYVPNLNGRNLKSQYTNVIGLFVTSVRGEYYNILADAIYQRCKMYGYELNIFVSEKSETMMANILGRRIDGAIILNRYIGERETALFSETQTPVIFMDRELEGEKLSCVVFDSYHEGEMVAEYLVGLGHRTFAYMDGPDDNYDNIQRLKGFREGLRSKGIILKEDYIIAGRFEKETAYQSMKQFADSGRPLPDAVFAANDVSAIGTIEALQKAGIQVPEQVSVVGCDDIEIAHLVKPSVTTVRTSFERQGTLAADHLIALIRGEETGRIDVLQGRIIPRESTCERKELLLARNRTNSPNLSQLKLR